MTDTTYTTITLPLGLAERIKRRIEGSGFTSLSGYVTFVLREILGLEPLGDKGKPDPITRHEKDEVLKRLRNLGYI